MEGIHRIDGIKYNFNRLTNDELESIRANRIAQVSQALADVALIEQELAGRRPVEQITLERTSIVQSDFQRRMVDL